MIELRKFEGSDIQRLIGWVPDARFLLQWSGPQYRFPLDAGQLLAALEKTTGTAPSHLMFKALAQPSGDVIGHIEFMNIDYNRRTALLGRVLIGRPEYRGRGYCKQMVEVAIGYGFNTLGLDTITLGVFDFNAQAIACYRALGFVEYERKPNARQFGAEHWTLSMMRLDRALCMTKPEYAELCSGPDMHRSEEKNAKIPASR